MAEQLIKKTGEGYSNVMPKSWIEAITDKSTGESLTHILQGFNMYFLSYTGNTEQTRCQVPKILRKKGLWITYVKYDGNVYTEWYNSNNIDDKSWGNSSNWRIGNNELVGDLTISANGNWVINGNETEFKAIGEKGNTPLIRIADNKLQVSYDGGDTYNNVSDNPVYTQIRTYNNKLQISTDLGANWIDASDEIAAYFRFNSGQGNNVGNIQISRNNKDWSDLSGNFVNNLHISKYIGADETLPTSGIAEGTIYAKGPTYAESDTSHNNPIYRLWVYAYKGNTLAWQDNGEFTSIAAGIVQETGSNENMVMSQKATTEVTQALAEIISKKVSFAGIATPTTNPDTPDGPVFYLAFESGEYSNFSVTINGNGIYIITNASSTWKAVKAYCLDIEQLKIYSYTNTSLVKTGDNMIDISRCLKGKYFNWNVGKYELLENSSLWCSPFIPVSPSTTYYTENLHSVLWFDKNYKKLSYVLPATSSVVSPEDAVFAVCNIFKKSGYFGLNANPVVTTFWQTLSDACKTNSIFPYSGRYPFSKEKIANGATTVIKNIYLDVEVEEGYSYSPGIIHKNKYIQIYKKVKDVKATGNAYEIMVLANARQIGNSKFYMLTSGKSWAIACFDELTETSYNNYDYDGFEFDERVTKGGIWSNFVFSEQLSELSEKLSEKLSELSELSKQTIDEEASEISVDYFEAASAFNPVYSTSTFSGFGFNVGSIDKSFRYLRTKVKVSDWVSSPRSVKQVLVQIRENDRNGTLLFSKPFTIIPISPGITKDIFIDLGEELSFPDKSLYLIIRFDSYAVLLNANSSTNPNTDNTGSYFTHGDINESTIGSLVTNGDTYKLVYFKLYSSLVTKLFLTDEQVSNIASRIEIPTPESEIVDISLPDKIYAIVGDTLQLFFRGIIKAVDPYKYNIVVSCLKGKQYPRYFEYTPTIQDVGQTNFAITVKDNNRKVISTKQCLLVTKNTVTSPSDTINVACFGDSLTAGGEWCKEAHRRLVESDGSPVGKGLTNIQFVGSRKIGTTGYFGVGGWTWDSYTTQGRPAYRFQVSGVSSLAVGAVYTNNGNTFTIMEVNVTAGSGNILCSVSSLTPAPTDSGTLTKSSGTGDSTITFSSYSQDTQNPLWDYGANKMTFIPYANTVADGNIDVVYTLLSWNGQASGKENFSDVIAKIKIFADTLHSEFPNAKLKIMGIQVPSVNGGMGANYGATGTSYADGYGMVVTALNQNKAYQDFANSEGYKDFVEFVNISAEFDTEYNMPYSETNVNTRSTVKEKRGTNGVHPSTEGYYQIADTVFRNFIANFCQ